MRECGGVRVRVVMVWSGEGGYKGIRYVVRNGEAHGEGGEELQRGALEGSEELKRL